MNNLITEALQIAITNWEFDGEDYKAELARLLLKEGEVGE